MKKNKIILGSAMGLAAIAVAIDHTKHKVPDPQTTEQGYLIIEGDEDDSPCGMGDSPCGMGEDESPCGMGEDESPCGMDMDESPCGMSYDESPCGMGDDESPCGMGESPCGM